MSIEPTQLEVLESRDGDTVRLLLRGELDLDTAEPLAERLRQLRDRRVPVLLDLDELTFIDASGVRLLLTAASDAQGDGWRFAVTHGSAAVRRLCELADLEGRLPFEEPAT